MEDGTQPRFQGIAFEHDLVLIKTGFDGSIPMNAAVSFLANQPTPETCSVVIFTPDSKLYDDSEHASMPLEVDEWLLANGSRGGISKLLSRLSIVRVVDLAQLAVCLSAFPADSLQQEWPKDGIMIILHDISTLSKLNSEQDLGRLLAIVGHGIGALRGCSGVKKFIIFDGHLSASTERILKCYLTQESIVDGRETEGPRRGVGDRRD
ncbi:SubName: Full=Uncharacterized protein {ECO:0000313/EMBL:CCA66990.1} [Serendipita indica DSM 11827]|nr:SubName: Full=Uncharacterized protein {ECO:0000313/EMBL:CCA66990.1} [Serendipita indica DSM 11827]